MGDFAMLQHLPDMYRHCKATEDKDMTPLDFITDHLINFDGLFDKHDHGDEQKPHAPIHTQHHGQSQVTLISSFAFAITPIQSSEVKPLFAKIHVAVSDYIFTIFRPPIV